MILTLPGATPQTEGGEPLRAEKALEAHETKSTWLGRRGEDDMARRSSDDEFWTKFVCQVPLNGMDGAHDALSFLGNKIT